MPPIAFSFSSYQIQDFVQIGKKHFAMTNSLRLIIGDMETNTILHSVNTKKNPQKKVIVGPNFDHENNPTMIMVLESGLFKMDFLAKKLIKIDHDVANGNIEYVVSLKEDSRSTYLISKSFNTGQLSLKTECKWTICKNKHMMMTRLLLIQKNLKP